MNTTKAAKLPIKPAAPASTAPTPVGFDATTAEIRQHLRACLPPGASVRAADVVRAEHVRRAVGCLIREGHWPEFTLETRPTPGQRGPGSSFIIRVGGVVPAPDVAGLNARCPEFGPDRDCKTELPHADDLDMWCTSCITFHQLEAAKPPARTPVAPDPTPTPDPVAPVEPPQAPAIVGRALPGGFIALPAAALPVKVAGPYDAVLEAVKALKPGEGLEWTNAPERHKATSAISGWKRRNGLKIRTYSVDRRRFIVCEGAPS